VENKEEKPQEEKSKLFPKKEEKHKALPDQEKKVSEVKKA
jgi:hypothetical protein